MKKTKTKKLKLNKNIIVLYFLGFILALSNALPTYIHSNFLHQFVDLQTISLFFIIANFFTFFIILSFPKIIKKFRDSALFKTLLVLFSLSLFFFSTANSALKGLFSIVFFSIAANLIFIQLDLLLEKFTSNSNTGRIRTIYFTFYNIGFVIAPFLSAKIAEYFSYNFVYWLAALLIVPAIILFSINAKSFDKKIEFKQNGVLKEFKKLWRNKNLKGIFIVAFILQLFFSMVVVYIPIYLHQNLGIGWESLGIIFSIMLLPFVLFEIPAGNLADKYFGEKEMLILGLVILSVTLFLFYYISVPTVWIWALVLFLSRVGAALIEAMRETYFFKLVDAEDIDMISIFRVTSPLAYMVGPGIGILILLFFPIQYLFLFMSVFVLLSLVFVFPMTDTK